MEDNSKELIGRNKGLSGSTLKIIAIITMLIDHIGAVILENYIDYSSFKFLFDYFPYSNDPISLFYIITRTIGRVAFPIFSFLLVEGFTHSRDVKRYGLRLFVFALISEIAFDLANIGRLDFSMQNIYFTLLIGLLTISLMDFCRNRRFSGVLIFIGGCCLAEVLRVDYGYHGIVAIVLFYIARDSKIKQIFANILGFFFEIGQWAAAYFSIPLIYFYNGKRGLNLKFIFYAFYPVHLLVLYFIKVYLLGG